MAGKRPRDYTNERRDKGKRVATAMNLANSSRGRRVFTAYAPSIAGSRAMEIDEARRDATSMVMAGEKKYYDLLGISMFAANAAWPAATGATSGTTCLNLVAQGASVVNRIGKKFVLKSLQFKGFLMPPATPAAVGVRQTSVFLVWDREPNSSNLASSAGAGASVAWSTYLQSADPASLTNRDNSTRFKTLRRWTFAKSTNTAALGFPEQEGEVMDFHYNFKKGKYATMLIAGSTVPAITDFVKGQLFLIVLGDVSYSSGAGTGANCYTLTGNARLDFSDY